MHQLSYDEEESFPKRVPESVKLYYQINKTSGTFIGNHKIGQSQWR